MPHSPYEIREAVVLENRGQKIFGILHRPLNKEKSPAVLFCHGLAGNKTGRFRLYVELAERLAKEGITVLRFDYRGCGDSEGEFCDITPEDHLSDALVALEHLASLPFINATQIGILGRSFGGPIAVQTAAQSSLIKSIVLWCPMFNGDQWRDQWQLVHSNTIDDASKEEMMMVEGQMGSIQFFDSFFKIDLSDALKSLHAIPLLHLHGESDTRINMHHADAFQQSRETSSARSLFRRLPQTDHEFTHRTERQDAINETVYWFVNTLR